MTAKYIIVDRCAIVFSAALTHSDIARGLKPESAGFVSFCADRDESNNPIIKVSAYGKSVSLGIESNPEEDSIRIAKQIINPYF
jgi:hypothetical protein